MAKERAFYCLNEQFMSNITGDIFLTRSSERFGNKHLASDLPMRANYLSDRSQCTLVNGYISELTLVQYGIPQGSLLGPRLYTIYVSDLPDAITLVNVLMYADDTTIYCIGKCFDEVCLKLNKILDELRLWSLRSKLSIHPIKTEAMILTKQGISYKHDHYVYF